MEIHISGGAVKPSLFSNNKIIKKIISIPCFDHKFQILYISYFISIYTPMPGKQLLVRYISYYNSIHFPPKIAANSIAHFASALYLSQKARPFDLLTFDFSVVEKVYPNGMLAIVAAIHQLRLNKVEIKIILPCNPDTRKLFRSTNWAFYLDSNFPKSESTFDKHLVTKQFSGFTEIPVIVNNFMDVVLRSIRMPKDIVSALEWSINEICDNVINHSNSTIGGFVQVITYPTKNLIAFSVADTGRGILNSLKEANPALRTDAQAIAELQAVLRMNL